MSDKKKYELLETIASFSQAISCATWATGIEKDVADHLWGTYDYQLNEETILSPGFEQQDVERYLHEIKTIAEDLQEYPWLNENDADQKELDSFIPLNDVISNLIKRDIMEPITLELEKDVLLTPEGMEPITKEPHCLLVLYSDTNRVVLDAEKEIVISDEDTLLKIAKLGYTKYHDMQSLFQIDGNNYATTDHIYFSDINDDSPERDKKSLKLVVEIMKGRNENIEDSFTCFDFSFPSNMISEKPWKRYFFPEKN